MPENPSCFDAILRRLLCSGEVPTHPSPHHIDPHSNQTQLITKPSPSHKNKPISQTNADVITPGIIARLMGLDSFPECNRVRNPDGVARSKSVSFADYLMEDSNAAPASLHRRVRTSVSFREVPEVMRLHEGQEFLVVYLDSVDKNKEEIGVRVMKKIEETKQGKTEEVKPRRKKRENNNEVIQYKKKNEKRVVTRNSKKVLKVKDENRRECKAQSWRDRCEKSKGDEGKKVVSKTGSVNLREEKRVVTRPKLKKGNHHNAVRRRQAVDTSSCPENSSPVLVFDIDDILIQHETWLSEYSSSKESKSQMKSPPRASYNEDPELRAVKFKDMEPVNNVESEDDTWVLGSKIFKMTEEELKGSNWVSRNEVEYERFEEICVEVEGLILDVLLNQTINDLVQLS